MRKTAVVHLTDEQRTDLTQRLERNPLTGRQWRRCQVLLLADQGLTDEQIVRAAGAGRGRAYGCLASPFVGNPEGCRMARRTSRVTGFTRCLSKPTSCARRRSSCWP